MFPVQNWRRQSGTTSIASKSTSKRDKDNLLSRGGSAYAFTSRTLLYMSFPVATNYRILRGTSVVFSANVSVAHKERNRLYREMNLRIGKTNVVKKSGAVTKSVKEKELFTIRRRMNKKNSNVRCVPQKRKYIMYF